MTPFLFLGTRAEEVAAEDEYAAMLRFSGLDEAGLVRWRLERDPLPVVDLAAWSGVILGGGPFTISDDPATKSGTQVRVEAELGALVAAVLEDDVPFLGCCYGIGVLGRYAGGVVDRTFGEPIGRVEVALSAEGAADPVFGALPPGFEAYVGHKEALTVPHDRMTVLASSPSCPVQAFRVGRNAYATQFHPELDSDGLCTRIDTYKTYGYFDPSEADALKEMARDRDVTAPPAVLRAFVERFAR